MITNSYLDTSIQKAFIPGVPGCLEQHQKLSAAITEAHKKHRSLTVCWLDLANAYGSVHHNLIRFALKHYHAPPCFVRVVSNLYTNLSATITCTDWSTKAIPLQVGVYQGDPLSVAIFNTVMATLADSLKCNQSLGYTFYHSPRSMNVLQYADDTCLVANGPASCQMMLQKVEGWLEWTGMKAKVPKCFSLAIAASTGKRYDPKLQLSGRVIPFIAEDTIKFLGAPIRVPLSNSHQKKFLTEKLEQLLQRVDEVPVTRKQKLLLYKAGICPRLNWDMAVMELPISWVGSTLEAKATRYLKRWSGLARSADPSCLYLPKNEGGLQLPSLTLLYKKLRASQASLLLASRDRITQHVTTRLIQHEENHHRASFKPMLLVRDVMADDPSMSRKGLVQKAKGLLAVEDADTRLKHVTSLPHQGQLLCSFLNSSAEIWSAAVGNLSSAALKFILNAATDTLPHNSNLSLWGRSPASSCCKLCGQVQTLLHVLNHCPIALELRRFNHRHDEVLTIIADFMRDHLMTPQDMIADLPGMNYFYPPSIGTTDCRPDIVVWRDDYKQVTLLELTVCFETNFDDAKRRKIGRYTELIEEAELRGYQGRLITIEVGSRGVLNMGGLQEMKRLLVVGRKEWDTFLIALSKKAIEESHKIWTARNWRGESENKSST